MADLKDCVLDFDHNRHPWHEDLGDIGGKIYHICPGRNTGAPCCEYHGLAWSIVDPLDKKARAENRQVAAFYAELEANPGVPPGPTALNARLGKTTGKTNVIGWSKLRRHLMHESGFVYNHTTHRYEVAADA